MKLRNRRGTPYSGIVFRSEWEWAAAKGRSGGTLRTGQAG